MRGLRLTLSRAELAELTELGRVHRAAADRRGVRASGRGGVGLTGLGYGQPALTLMIQALTSAGETRSPWLSSARQRWAKVRGAAERLKILPIDVRLALHDAERNWAATYLQLLRGRGRSTRRITVETVLCCGSIFERLIERAILWPECSAFGKATVKCMG